MRSRRGVALLFSVFSMTVFATVGDSPKVSAASVGVTVAGGNGAGPGADQLYFPYTVEVDDTGNVYIADAYNHRVQRWAPGAAFGETVAGGNGAGAGADQLDRPYSFALDAAGNLFVSDSGNHRVQRWAPGATAGETVAGGNGAGSAANQLNRPTGLAFDGAGNLYIVDSDNFRVQRWAPGASFGVTVAGGHGFGWGPDQFANAFGITVDGDGNLYVADTVNGRIQLWAPGATFGQTLVSGFDYPFTVVLDHSGDLYVADTNNNRIVRRVAGGSVWEVVAGGNGPGSGADQLYAPIGLAIDASGNLYIGDTWNHRVQKWTVDVPPLIDGADDMTVPAAEGLCSATVVDPVTVTGEPVPDVTYNGGDWPIDFPVGTTSVAVHAVNSAGSADATFVVTVTDGQVPTVAMMPDRTVPATGPSGAIVSYTPAVGDNCPGVTFTATPTSGSVFPIGDTAVVVTAVDASLNQTVGALMTVHVAGAGEQLATLRAASVGVGPGKALAAKIDEVVRSVNRSQTTEACAGLASYAQLVQAQSGKKIPPVDASELIAAARRIATVLGCPS